MTVGDPVNNPASEHWLVSMDLSGMDEILAAYTSFLASELRPAAITFIHIIESGSAARRIVERFPELESREALESLVRSEIDDKTEGRFDDLSIDVQIMIREGYAADQLLDTVQTLKPELVIMGKKTEFSGDGDLPKQILKYVPTSILLVPEQARHRLNNALVPVDFSEPSAKGIDVAQTLVKSGGGGVTALHIYRYRTHFFPYILSDEEKERVDREVEIKKAAFIDAYNISPEVQIVMTRSSGEQVADIVYELAHSRRVDIIVAVSKAKRFPGIIRRDFIDRLVDYPFDIPLLIPKNRVRHQRLLESMFKR